MLHGGLYYAVQCNRTAHCVVYLVQLLVFCYFLNIRLVQGFNPVWTNCEKASIASPQDQCMILAKGISLYLFELECV